MSQTSQLELARPLIKSAVLRLQQGNLILPMNLLVELVTVEQLDKSDNPGILGWLNWLGRSVPVVSLESLCMLGEGVVERSSNCLVLHTVLDCVELPFIALQVQGGLQTIDVGEDTLRDDYSGNLQRCPYVARQVRIAQLLCLIPDMPAIEAAVAEVLQLSE